MRASERVSENEKQERKKNEEGNEKREREGEEKYEYDENQSRKRERKICVRREWCGSVSGALFDGWSNFFLVEKLARSFFS